jgi:hypothetical protein
MGARDVAESKAAKAVTTLLILGTLLMVGAGIGIWAERQALDTDEWFGTRSQLLENEPSRTAVGLHLVDRLYGWVLFGLAIVAFAVAVFLAPDRRRTTLSAGVCLIVDRRRRRLARRARPARTQARHAAAPVFRQHPAVCARASLCFCCC